MLAFTTAIHLCHPVQCIKLFAQHILPELER